MKKQLFRSSRYSQAASLLVGSQGILPQASPSLWYVITECCFAAYRSGLHHSDTSKSQSVAYCFAQLKQGTCLIRLNYITWLYCGQKSFIIWKFRQVLWYSYLQYNVPAIYGSTSEVPCIPLTPVIYYSLWNPYPEKLQYWILLRFLLPEY